MTEAGDYINSDIDPGKAPADCEETAGPAGPGERTSAVASRSAERTGPRQERAGDPVALSLLTVGTALAAGVAHWMEVRGRNSTDVPMAQAFLGFSACLVLAFLAGRRVPAPPPPSETRSAPRPERIPVVRAVVAAGLGLLSAGLFARTWRLQGNPPYHADILASWFACLAAAAGAFALLSPRARAIRRPSWPAVGILALLLAAGVWCRLVGLDLVPAGFAGDEASQALDGMELVTGNSQGDPFGTGWYGAMRLGMLPAGVGAVASGDSIAGPRRPYALAGILSLFAATAAGWLLAGTWGALGTAASLAFSPFHLHFSRIAGHTILDSLTAALLVALILYGYRRPSPVLAFASGAVAGLAFYGYAGGRVMPIMLAAAALSWLFTPVPLARRALVLVAVAAGFFLAAAPNLRFASTHFADWGGRFNQVGIFRKEWWVPEVARYGSPTRLLLHQFVEGTAGLLCRHTGPTYTGYPPIAPNILPAMAVAGLGWLLGRRLYLASVLLALLVAGNFAGIILTDTTPMAHRASSLFPALAILSGAAIAGFVRVFPRPGGRGAGWSAAMGTLLLGAVILPTIPALPPWQEPSPDYGWDTAAFVLSASRVLSAPRFRLERVYLDGMPYMDTSFPSFGYLLAASAVVDRNPALIESAPPPPGWHLVSPEWATRLPALWRKKDPALRSIALPDPRDPRRDLGCLLRIREPVENSPVR